MKEFLTNLPSEDSSQIQSNIQNNRSSLRVSIRSSNISTIKNSNISAVSNVPSKINQSQLKQSKLSRIIKQSKLKNNSNSNN